MSDGLALTQNTTNEDMKMKIQHVHISKIKNGDVILHNGREMTVSSEYIKKGFSGITIFGDSYNCGYKLVTKILFGEDN